MIHVSPPGTGGLFIKGLARFAVPVFFICSGYFSYKLSITKDYSKIGKRILSLFKMLIITFVIYYIGLILISNPEKFYSALVSFDGWKKFFLANYLFVSWFSFLWFLSALIYCYAIYAVFIKIKLVKILKLTPILIIAAIVVFDFLVRNDNYNVNAAYFRNFLFDGLPFFMVGFIIKENESKIKKLGTKIPLVFTAAGIGIFIAEFIFVNDLSELYFGTAIMAVSLFIFALNFKCPDCFNKLYLIDSMSLYIYLSHKLIKEIVTKLFNDVFLVEASIADNIKPVVVLTVSILFSYLISKVIDKGKHKKNNMQKIS